MTLVNLILLIFMTRVQQFTVISLGGIVQAMCSLKFKGSIVLKMLVKPFKELALD